MTARKLLYYSISAIVLIACYFLLTLLGGCRPKVNNSRPDFAIKDTSQVDQVQITEANGNSIVIQRRTTPDVWKLNSGDFDAREDAIELILETIFRIKIKQEVDENSRDNVINQIATSNKKVNFYRNNASLPFKTYYVGNSTPDKLGTFMVVSENIDGEMIKSNPYIVYKPGMYGHLESRFFSDSNEWRSTAVFKYGRGTISRIHLQFFEEPQKSHVVEVDQKGGLKLFANTGEAVSTFNIKSVQRYVTLMMRLNYEGMNKELSMHEADSVMRSKPLYSISVTDINGSVKKVLVHRKKAPPGLTDYKGDPILWDKDRYWGHVEGRTVLMKLQFFSWGPVFKPISFFQ
jgi:hypothetical protein